MIEKLRQTFSLTLLLEIAGLARATYYYHRRRQSSPDRYAALKEQIRAIYQEHRGRYGYRRITMELTRRGMHYNHKTIQRLMKEMGLISRVRKKKHRSFKGQVGITAPNLLNRCFKAKEPNEKWVTEITEIQLFGQKLYVSVLLDLYSQDVVSYSIAERPTLSLVREMLNEGLGKTAERPHLILHSDQGWQYQHKQYRLMLEERGIQQSMSRKGNCLDNAVIENFFGILKSELVYMEDFHSIEQFKEELSTWITTIIVERKQDLGPCRVCKKECVSGIKR